MSKIIVGERQSAAERRRAARIKEAVAHLKKQLPGNWTGRAQAIRSIERAPNAMKEAQRLVEWHHRQWAKVPDPEPLGRRRGTKVKTHTDHRDRPDHSDVQALRVKIANRDGALACAVHKRMIDRLDQDIARGRLTPEQFAKRAAKILRTPQAWPKDLIKAELELKADPDMSARMEAEWLDQAGSEQEDAATGGPVYVDRRGFKHRSPAGTRQLVATPT